MRTAGLVVGLFLVLPAVLPAQPPANVAAVLQRYCVECHQGGKAKGDLRLDTLPADFATTAAAWGKVHDRAADRSMPPGNKPKPTDAELKVLTDWVGDGLGQVEAARAAREGRTTLRRLNRTEYAHTLRDLLAIDLDLTHQLPEDATAHGFDNVAAALQLSSAHLERYLEGADLALDAALFLPPMPKPEKKLLTPGTPEGLRLAGDKSPLAAITKGDSLVLFRNTLGRELFRDRFRTDAAGIYKVRIPLVGHNLDDKDYAVEIATGTTSGASLFHRVDYYDLTRATPTRVVEFEKRLPRGATFRLVGYGFPQLLKLDDPKSFAGPGWGFGPVEVEGPLLKNWPPESRTRLIGKLDLAKGTLADAEAVLKSFLPRAFRRPTTPADVAPFVKVVRDRLAKGDKFDPALRAGLKAVLCSPDFLFLREKPGPLDDNALACRLSYFLWSSMPDDALFAVARTGKLSDPKTLREQVERMLADPKAGRFTENFTAQWLSLKDIDFTTPDKKLFPEYDDRLQDALLAETHGYFDEMLKQNRPVAEFLASDWTILNGRLAKHYGIPGVAGQAMRRVALPPGSVRGGVLTQAAVLKVTANGTTTSPVTRGVWVLEHLLGQPAPPPPPGVPAVEPDTRGAVTIRDQLAKHRNVEACAGCHKRIDPPGFALEAFDPIGGLRDRYRTAPAKGQRPAAKLNAFVPATNATVELALGLPVEQGDVLPDGRRFKDVAEYKKLLLTEKEQFTRALVEKLATYATGTPPGRADRDAVEAIVAAARQRDGFRDLVHAVVASPLFLRK